MNDNYLWDRTGEPDPQLQELEEVLASLRYEPRPLQIPANFKIAKQRRFNPLAIAAAVAVLMLAGGLFVRLTRKQTGAVRQPVVAQAPKNPPAETPAPSTPNPGAPAIATLNRDKQPNRRRSSSSVLAASKRRKTEPDVPVLTEQELAEKEQVLLALRMVSAKLNFAQRRIQGLPPANSIRNHKIG
jgi:hypothetical protein